MLTKINILLSIYLIEKISLILKHLIYSYVNLFARVPDFLTR